ncbi:MAG TPA: FAD-binding domain-containing protein [archaeon]
MPCTTAFRIFNPWLQQRRYDPDCRYIKTWIPELREIAPALLHSPEKLNAVTIPCYPAPIVNHAIESVRAKKAYRVATKGTQGVRT